MLSSYTIIRRVQRFVKSLDNQCLLTFVAIAYLSAAELLYYLIGAEIKYSVVYFVLASAICGSSSLIIKYYGLIGKVWKSAIGKWMIGISAVALSNIAFVCADANIINSTGFAPALFPRAQSILTFWFSLVICSTVLFIILFFIYIVVVVHALLQIALQSDFFFNSTFYRSLKVIQGIRRSKPTIESTYEIAAQIAALAIVLILVFLGPLNMTSKEKVISNLTRRAILFGSFMQNGEKCMTINEKDLIMPLTDNSFIVYKADHTFSKIACK